MKIITITGYKGGVGKSTTAVHLAAFLSEIGSALLVDGDSNRTAIAWADRGALPFRVVDERQALKVIGGHDFVVIDTPARPDSDDLKELAKGCDLLVLPTSPDVVSLEPMLMTAHHLPPSTPYRAFVSIVPPYPSKEGETMRDDLRESGIPVFQTLIRRTAAFAKAALQGKTVRQVASPQAANAWGDYSSLGKEILEVLNG